MRTLLLGALVPIIGMAGCGDTACNPARDASCLTPEDERKERQADAAYDCMPAAVQKAYDRLLDQYAMAPQGVERTRMGSRLDALTEEYLPRVGEECR